MPAPGFDKLETALMAFKFKLRVMFQVARWLTQAARFFLDHGLRFRDLGLVGHATE
jgi:hypothetical protein